MLWSGSHSLVLCQDGGGAASVLFAGGAWNWRAMTSRGTGTYLGSQPFEEWHEILLDRGAAA